MSENKDTDSKITRRDFLKTAVRVAGGIGVAGLASCAPPQKSETPEQGKPYYSGGDKKEVSAPIESYWEGEVKEGEGLTHTVIRVAEANTIQDFKENTQLVWEHNGVNIIFENWNSFLWQDVISLPVTWPKDKVSFGCEDKMESKIAELRKLPMEQTVFLKSRMKPLEGAGIEQTISIAGGRYDHPIMFVFNSNENYWKVNPERDVWLDARKLKEVMDASPEMKSSEALDQLQEN